MFIKHVLRVAKSYIITLIQLKFLALCQFLRWDLNFKSPYTIQIQTLQYILLNHQFNIIFLKSFFFLNLT